MLAVKPSGPRFHRSFVALFPGLPAGPLAAWPTGLRGGRLAVQPQPLGPLPVPTTARRRGGSDGTPARSRRRSTPIGITFPGDGDGDGRPATTSHRPLILREERPAQRRQPPQRLALRRVQPLRQHQRTTPRRRTRHPRTVKLSPRPPSDPRPEPAARLPAGHPLRMPAAAFRHLSAWNHASGDLASNSRPQSGHAHTSITTSPAHSHRLAMLRHGTDPLS